MPKMLISVSLIGMLILSSCNLGGKPTPTVDAPGTYTAVALTLQFSNPALFQTATATLLPSASPTIAITPTVASTIQPSPTTKSSVYPYISWTPSTCDFSQFVADVTIPDGTKFYPGTKFTKTWRILNSGTCTWTKEYRFTYISGNKMGADTIYLPKSVAPGQYIEISMDMTAPDVVEDYSNFWRLRNATGLIFGDAFYVVIEVTNSAKTLTPSASSTTTAVSASPTASPTATPTTAVATNTTIPTETSIPPSNTPETPVPEPT